jgi:type II secretory pathway pseudopilin PulG
MTNTERGFTLTELLITLVIMIGVTGIITQTAVQATRVYGQQRKFIEARRSAGAALDMMVRLIRMSQTITPDPDGNGQMDSISLQSDWNPRNGALTDPYETISFTVANNQLLKQEPSDAAPVPFADGITSITFAYFDQNNVALANPVTSVAKIAYVTVTVQTVPPTGLQPIVMTSAATVRRME